MARLFVSYAHSDGSALVQRLADDLARSGHEVWWDRDRLRPGASWTTSIEEAIDNAAVVIALLSHGSHCSDVCRAEQLRALRKGKRLIPLLVQRDADRALHLETTQFLSFCNAESYSEALASLEAAIAGESTALLPAKYRNRYITAPPLPIHFVPRPDEIDILRRSIINESGGRRVALTAVRAMGGIGKTVLAQAICRDSIVQDAFPDGVIWTTIGQNPGDAYLGSQLREIAKALGSPLDPNESLQGASNHVRTTIENHDKAALIILDDVWDPHVLRWFLAESLRTRILLTTRQREVVYGAGAAEVCLGVLTPDLARSLLSRASATPVNELPVEADLIAEECGRLPLALAMAGALVRKNHGDWQGTLQRFRTAQLSQVGIPLLDYLHPSLAAAIQVSVDALGEHKRRYFDLAVFRDDVAVPAPTLSALWGVSEQEAQRTMTAWEDASLATSDKFGIRLHDLQMDFVRVGAGDTVALHKRLVDGYRRRSRGNWLILLGDSYLLTWLPYHVSESGDMNGLLDLLQDPQWMRAKLAGKSIRSLLDDFQLAPRGLLGYLESAIRRGTVVLARHPNLLTSQLVALLRPYKSPAIRRVLQAARETEVAPWLEPVWPETAVEGDSQLGAWCGHTEDVTAVAFLPHERLLSVSWDGTFRIWAMEGGTELSRQDVKSRPDAMAITKSGGRLLLTSEKGPLLLWDLDSPRLLAELKSHTHRATSAAITPDGLFAVSGSWDKILTHWCVPECRCLATFPHRSPVTATAILPSGRLALCGTATGEVWLYHLWREYGTQVSANAASEVTSLAWSPGGRVAAAGFADGSINLYEFHSGAPSIELQFRAAPPQVRRDRRGQDRVQVRVSGHALHAHYADVNAVAVSADGRWLLTGSSDRSMKLWDVSRWTAVRTFTGHSGAVTAVAFSGDASRALSGAADNSVRLWDLTRGELDPALERAGSHHIAFNGAGNQALSSSASNISLWDLQKGERTPLPLDSRFSILDLVPNASRPWAIVIADRRSLLLRDCSSGETSLLLPDLFFGELQWAVSGDGRRLAVTDGERLRFFDLDQNPILTTEQARSAATMLAVSFTGQYVASVDDSRGMAAISPFAKRPSASAPIPRVRSRLVSALACHSDGRTVALALENGEIEIWNLETGRRRTTQAHRGRVHKLLLSPDDLLLLSVSEDQTFKVWNLDSLDEIATFAAETAIRSCAVTVDGRLFAICEASGRIHFLQLRYPAARDHASSRD